jgi:outer membrane protein assembly factor BamD (BamD/ComL family)
MKSSYIFALLSILLFSCNNESNKSAEKETQTPEKVLASIQVMDDSLQILMDKRMKEDAFKIDKVVYHEAINRNKKFYELFPSHEKAERALEKIASLYMQIGVESEAAKWRDTILIKYPNNINKIGLLEMQMNYHDYDNYDSVKIEYYADQLLSIENLPKEKKEDYEFRLKHIDKTFDELIEIRMKEMDSINKTEENS